MDLHCTTCGEPWDFDALHEEVAYREQVKGTLSIPDGKAYQKLFSVVRADFAAKGCAALTCMNSGPCKPASQESSDRALMASAMHDLLGDDIDGIAAMMEDYC